MKKDVLFTIHMYGAAQVEDVSEIKNIGCKVTFDRENVSVGTIEVEVNSVANIDKNGVVAEHSYPIASPPN